MTGVDRFFLNTFKMLLWVAAASAATVAPALSQPLPAAGHPGCYAKIAYPAAYKTVTQRVAGPPVVSYRDRPAVIEHYARRVLVAPAQVEHETIAPVYRTGWRWIEVAGPVRQIASPPVYRTVTERRLISPAHLAWRPGGSAHGFAPGYGYGQSGALGRGLRARPTGEVLCRVLIPARYAWTSRRVLISPGRRLTVQGPPCHVRVRDRVLVQPGHTVRHVVAAVYRTVHATRVVRPACHQRIVSPGPVRLVSHRLLVRPARYGWAPIVCTPRPGRQRPAPTPPPPPPAQPYGGQADQSYGAPAYRGPAYNGQTYGAPAYGAPPAPVQAYSGGRGYGDAAARPAGHAYRPNEILAPTPGYPPTSRPPLVPAPYDIGHPAQR